MPLDHGEEVAGERVIPDSDAPQALQFGKESGRIGMGACAKAAEIKRAANFGKTLTTGRIAGLCRCRTPRKELHLDAYQFLLSHGAPSFPTLEDVRERPSQTVWKHGAMIRMASEKSGIIVVGNPKDSGRDKSGSC
jgi:hypothetical protein